MHISVTEKGQITIPAAMRRKLGIKPGGSVNVVINEKNRQILIRRSGTLDDIVGMLGRPPSGKRLTIEEIDDAIGEAISDHVLSSLTPKPKRKRKT